MLQSKYDREVLATTRDSNVCVVLERERLDRWHSHDGPGYGSLNDEKEKDLHCAHMYDLAICNMFCFKRNMIIS